MLQKTLSLFFISIVIISFVSCQFNTVYNEVVIIEKSEWEKDKAAHFEVYIEDTTALYDFFLVMHNTTDYRYSNLFIFMSTTFPNRNQTRDTIELVLADVSGKWFGKGWGNVKETDVLLKSDLSFPLTGNYEFFIQHAMRSDTLDGIRSVGLRIEKLSN